MEQIEYVIAEKLAEIWQGGEDGRFSADIERELFNDNWLDINVCGEFDVDGYVERDTNAWVCTRSDLFIEKIEGSFNGKEIELTLDEQKILREFRRLIA